MSNQIQAIRLEIERLKTELPRETGRGAGTLTTKGYGMLCAYDLVLEFIDSLPESSEDDTMRKELKQRIHSLENGLQAMKELIDSNAWKEFRVRTWGENGSIICQFYEKESSEDLDDEIERFYNECIIVHEAKVYNRIERVIEIENYEIVARHFAKWGAEHVADNSKTLCEDLEEAAEEFARMRGEFEIVSARYFAFIAGANWQKEQLKDKDNENTI